MSKKFTWSLCLIALALCLGSLPAMAQQAFYTDLGPQGNVYNCCTGWTISGTGTVGTSFTSANLFTSTLTGSISQVDFGVGYVTGTNSFYAGIYADNAGVPGAQVAGAMWTNLSSGETFGQCCGLVTVTGISGVNLTAGTQYFMVLGPTSTSSTTWEAWNENNQGATNLELYSENGGSTWNSNGQQTIGAFDILGSSTSTTSTTGTTPEPSSLLLLGTGLVGAFGTIRRKLNR